MDLKVLAVVGFLACIYCLADDACVSASQMKPEGSRGGLRARFNPSKLFDFNQYKKVFKKSYPSVIEELVRKKYFISRALRAFISAVQYKYGRRSYYLAVNHMSDMSAQEYEKTRNKAVNEPLMRGVQAEAGGESLAAEFVPRDGENVEEELKTLAASERGPGFDELREIVAGQGAEATGFEEGVRQLPIERLIEDPEAIELDAETAQKVRLRVASNNPNYKQPHLGGSVRRDDLREVKFKTLLPPEPEPDLSVSMLGRMKMNLMAIKGKTKRRKSASEERFKGPKADGVFVDHRDTKCFFPPRDQGKCGSCYAFAITAIFEWLHCMQTGQLVPFSEQYILDCGSKYYDNINGCDGGNPFALGNFMRNFGAELRTMYPYVGQPAECPYTPKDKLTQTGYIRFEFGHATEIYMDLFEKHLASGPIFISISTAPDFIEYGGGVHGQGCHQRMGSHAVVLVGHGREDGQEYWLIRNSHSAAWGEAGYYKLSKKANCIHPEFGFLYGTRDGFNPSPKITNNTRHDEQLIRRFHANELSA